MENEHVPIETIEKALEKQMQLLSERSKSCSDHDLAKLSSAMVRIAEWFYCP